MSTELKIRNTVVTVENASALANRHDLKDKVDDRPHIRIEQKLKFQKM